MVASAAAQFLRPPRAVRTVTWAKVRSGDGAIGLPSEKNTNHTNQILWTHEFTGNHGSSLKYLGSSYRFFTCESSKYSPIAIQKMGQKRRMNDFEKQVLGKYGRRV